MRRSLCLLALAAAAVAGAATAQTVRLTAEEARAELFGVELVGIEESTGDSWSECIERSGRTWYVRGEERKEGFLDIRPNGQACFNYPPDLDWACFSVAREGENYRFDSFITRRVRRDVEDCGVPIDAWVRLGARL